MSLKEGINCIKRLFGQHDNAKTLIEIIRNSVRLPFILLSTGKIHVDVYVILRGRMQPKSRADG